MDAVRLETGRVPYGEESRRYRRTVFRSADDWRMHRDPDRLQKNLSNTLVSGVARSLTKNISIITSVGALVVAWNSFLFGSYAGFDGASHPGIFSSWVLSRYLLLELPPIPFTVSSPVLGLLLVFRTNSSYQRWFEGRNQVTKVVSNLQNILRMSTVWCPQTTEGRQSLEELGVSCWILMRSVQNSLRDPDEDEADYASALTTRRTSPNALESILKSRDRSLWALNDVSAAIDRLPIEEARRREIDKSAVAIADSVEKCKSIYRSPVPLVYTRHTDRFLAMWLLLLPLALYNEFDVSWNHITLIPASLLIGLFLLGVDELAIQLEEPFSILPLENSCDIVKESADNAMEWHAVNVGTKNV